MTNDFTLDITYVEDEFTMKRLYHNSAICWNLEPNDDSLDEIIDTVQRFTDFYSLDGIVPIFAISADMFNSTFNTSTSNWILAILPENIESIAEMNVIMNKYGVKNFKEVASVRKEKAQ